MANEISRDREFLGGLDLGARVVQLWPFEPGAAQRGLRRKAVQLPELARMRAATVDRL